MTAADVSIQIDKAPHRLGVEEAMAEFDRLRALVPHGTRLSTMTVEDMKRELETRD